MIKSLTARHLVVLLGLMVLLVACSSPRKNWAGITQVESSDELVVAFDRMVAKLAPSGERVWIYPQRDEQSVNFYANPTIVEGVVYVGDYTGGVHAIDLETGAEIWVYEQGGSSVGFLNFGGSTDRVIGGVTLVGDMIYVPDEEGVFALDRETGQRNPDWVFQAERAVWSPPLYIPDEPARLIVSGLDHHLYALDPQTGKIQWQTNLGGAIPSSPTYDAETGLLFAGTYGSEVVAVRAQNGDIVSRFQADDWVWEAPTLYEDKLYFTDLKGNLYAAEFVENNFELLWEQKIATGEGRFRAAPLVSDDLLIVGSDNKFLYGVNRETGEVDWETDTKLEVLGDLRQIQSEDETLVVVTTSDRGELVMGFRVDNGNKRWTYEHKN